MIRKMITPKTMLPLVIRWPKALMTVLLPPALPKICRVVETFSPKRNSVVISSSEGKMENSCASAMVMVIIRIRMDREMLMIKSRSSRKGGMGITRKRTMTTTKRAMLFWRSRLIGAILSECVAETRNAAFYLGRFNLNT